MESPGGGGGCPVDHSSMTPEAASRTARLLAGGCPVDHGRAPVPVPERGACDSSKMGAVTLMPREGSEPDAVGDVFPDARPHPSQRASLSSVPVSSSIPKGGSGTEEGETWTYPSPQRFYNAMKKKGWDPKEGEMPWVVSIHNTVNERCWRKVLEYEGFHEGECAQGAKLVRFRGKPDVLSPKARIRSWRGYVLPFDRHDWTVDRCGPAVEYIIDFSEGSAPPGSGAPPAVFLDVRPKLNCVGGFVDRARMAWKNFFSISHGKSSS